MAESSIQQVAKKNCRPGIIACRSILPTQIFRKESTSFASAGKGWKIPGDSFFSNQTEKKKAGTKAGFFLVSSTGLQGLDFQLPVSGFLIRFTKECDIFHGEDHHFCGCANDRTFL